jgi:UDP:flavonoid glycosyltransferase YjiC (YdhE family)
MRVLCSCNPVLGHLYPMLPLADALHAAGHDVVFVTGRDLETAIGTAGFELRVAGPDFATLLAETFSRYPDTPLATPEDQQRFGFGRLFSELRVELAAEPMSEVALDLAPDLILHEVADFAAPLVAARLGLPSTTVGVGLVPLDDLLGLAARAVAPAWRAAGLDPPADAGAYRTLYLNQLPRTVQRDLGAIPAVRDLRPLVVGEGTALPDDLDGLGRDRPLVYVSFGTVFGDPARLDAVVAGITDLDVDVLVTVGPEGDPDLLAPAGRHVTVRRFVPQGAVLARCRLAVTHGGVGSLIGPLRFGVPVVVLPQGADQQENAAQVAATGAGIVLDPGTLDAGSVGAAARAVMADDAMSRVARELRDEIAAMPAPTELVPALEAVVAAGPAG